MTISAFILAAFLASAQLVSLDTKDMDLGDFFRVIANITKMNVVLHPAVQGKVNLMVKDAPVDEVMNLVLRSYGLAKEVEGNIMRIAPAATIEAEQRQKTATADACLKALPLETRIYVLNYARASDVSAIISKTLSPRGSVVAYTPRNALIVTDVQHAEQCSR